MATHITLTSERIDYDASPEIQDFLARVALAANDPAVTVSDIVGLIYGEQNPMLVRGVIPGMGLVTAEVHASPVYRVLTDYLDRKRVQAGTLDPAAAEAAYTLTVADAARQLGISESAVRQAIARDRLDAKHIRGRHMLRPEAIASYQRSNRGPAPAVTRSPELELVTGTEGDAVVRVKHEGGELVQVRDDERRGVFVGKLAGDWVRAWVLTSWKADGSSRLFVIEPGRSAEEIRVGDLGVRGHFHICARQNNAKLAHGMWKNAPGSER